MSILFPKEAFMREVITVTSNRHGLRKGLHPSNHDALTFFMQDSSNHLACFLEDNTSVTHVP